MNYIIRVHCQGLGLKPKELIDDLKANGLTIHLISYSSFGDCFFIEVSGNYTGTVKTYHVTDDAINFDWDK
jgi:hypothetical protein